MNKTWAAADDAAKNQCDENGVVELSDNRNEVRDQVDRRGEVRDQRRDEHLLRARESLVPQKPGQQHDAVGNEPRDRSRVLAPAGGDGRHERCLRFKERSTRIRPQMQVWQVRCRFQ